MRLFQGVIEFTIFLILLGVAVWWSCFCFTKGYALGKNGTDNRFADWAIETVLGAEKDSESDESAPTGLQWFREILDGASEEDTQSFLYLFFQEF